MKLTKQDEELLLHWGYTEEDFPQIERATLKTKTDYFLDGKLIDREQAIQILGRSEYLSGIVRSAFHWSASREADDGRRVRFDSSRLFKA